MSFPSFWWWSWRDDQAFRSDACEKPGMLCYGTGGVKHSNASEGLGDLQWKFGVSKRETQSQLGREKCQEC